MPELNSIKKPELFIQAFFIICSVKPTDADRLGGM